MTDLTAADADLVARLPRGDAAAARELYERHGAALLRFGLAMSNHRPTAEDIVHDTFVELLKYPARFNPEKGSVLAYLFGIARHRMSHVARISMRHAEVRLTEDDEGLAPSDAELQDVRAVEHSPDAGDELDRARNIERVRAAVFDLPRVHREVIALCDLEELPYATAASILECPIGTVRSRLSRARALLAARLAPPEPEDEDDHSQRARAAELGVESSALTLSCRGTLT